MNVECNSRIGRHNMVPFLGLLIRDPEDVNNINNMEPSIWKEGYYINKVEGHNGILLV